MTSLEHSDGCKHENNATVHQVTEPNVEYCSKLKSLFRVSKEITNFLKQGCRTGLDPACLAVKFSTMVNWRMQTLQRLVWFVGVF